MTGPSTVHDLARQLVELGFISRTGIALHEAGPKTVMDQFAAFGIWLGDPSNP
jgi:hypothetical protein